MENRRKFMRNMTGMGLVFTSLPSFGSINSIFSESHDPDKDGVFIITKGEHKPEEIAAAIAEIPPVNYQPTSDRWLNLPRAAAALAKENGELRVVMLGDSIINDTYRSQWYDLFQAQYPKCKITATAVVRGSTGCWWYKDSGRVKHYVEPLQPDLLIIGGISQKDDTESIAEVMRQVNSAKQCDVLLMTGPFGEVDPANDQQWTFDIPVKKENYRKHLYDLAITSHAGFLDMTAHWGRYILQSQHPILWFKRDVVHANIRGEQVIGHILASHLSPPLPK